MSETQLTVEELERAFGGRKTLRSKEAVKEAALGTPNAPSTGMTPGSGEELPDAPYQTD